MTYENRRREASAIANALLLKEGTSSIDYRTRSRLKMSLSQINLTED